MLKLYGRLLVHGIGHLGSAVNGFHHGQAGQGYFPLLTAYGSEGANPIETAQDLKENVLTSTKQIIYDYLGQKGLLLSDFFFNLIVALLILLIGFRIVNVLRKILNKILERSKVDVTLRTFLNSAANIAMRVLVIFMAVTQLGVASSSIIALLGSAALAVGLSLQGSLANIAGGVILLFIKPFRVGDYILEEGSGKEGTVKAIGIIYTELLTADKKAVMIPNGNLANSSITNMTHEHKRRMEIDVGISYGQDIGKVRKALLMVAKREKYCLQDDLVNVVVTEFLDSSIMVQLRYWVEPQNYWEARFRSMEDIIETFEEEGISIPYNQLDVHLELQDNPEKLSGGRLLGDHSTEENNIRKVRV